jgi:hypothetical protein
MTKYSRGSSRMPGSRARPAPGVPVPHGQRGPEACELYDPGHMIHYTHQGSALHSRSRVTRDAVLDDTLLTLVLDDGETLHWRHHDPERLGRILELLRRKCVVYPDHHAVRVGPYWFNCAAEGDEWLDCRASAARPR